jgi:hypothetical protein
LSARGGVERTDSVGHVMRCGVGLRGGWRLHVVEAFGRCHEKCVFRESRDCVGSHWRFSRVQWCGANDRGRLRGAVNSRLTGEVGATQVVNGYAKSE